MTSLAGATQDEVRRSNLSLVLTLLHRRGAMSRSQIVATTGLNRSTVGDLVQQLDDAGLVRESAGVGGGVGRPSLLVEPVADSVVSVALDVRVERTVVAVIGLGGQVLHRDERKHRERSPDVLLREVIDLAEDALARLDEPSSWIGAGIGVPGVVRVEDGLVRFAPNLGWVDFPLGQLVNEALQSRYGARPVRVSNDSDLGVLAEHLRGAGQGADNVIFLSGEVGIGGGVIIDGRPLTGAGGYGGEAGHMRVNPLGRICRCGTRGCWETEIGREVLVSEAGLSVDDADVADVIAAAAAGDRAARQALGSAATWLGIGLGNLVNLFNPQTVVLGGHLGQVFSADEERVNRELSAALPAAREQVSINSTALGGDATLIGAGELGFEQLLADPIGMLTGLRAAS